jgi:hypothetical protein
LLTKLEPDAVNANPEPPAVLEAGLMLFSIGVGLEAGEIVNVLALDVPPPGAGVNTVTFAVPALAMSPARMFACRCMLSTKVVARLCPFHWTTEFVTKLEPDAVNTNPEPPATADVGLMLDNVGAGPLTVNVTAFDVPPPGAGLNTVTGIVAEAARSAP